MIDNKVIYQVDSFTEMPFKGNPAGVMIVNEETPAEWMQNVALEMNLSETAFVIPKKQGFRIRYFTPSTEVPLCGHATLASAHVLYEQGFVRSDEPVSFSSGEGELTIHRDNDWIVMNFPVYSLSQIPVPADFKKLVGFEPIEAWQSDDSWIIGIAGTENEVYSAKPDFGSLVKMGLGHLIITARGTYTDADFVVRCFAPLSGIDEDPVTGSAHCALTPLWHQKTGKKEMDSFQVSYRTGHLKVKLLNNRVEISGKAVTIFKASLKI